MGEIRCRHFSGYKPCGKSETACERSACAAFDEVRENILIVHLGALGAVMRSTALLAALKRKHPASRLVWVTDSPAHYLLQHNPLIDEVILSSQVALHPLTALRFSFGYCIDKSLKAFRLLQEFKVEKILGFRADEVSGAVLPASPAAEELWSLGLSNHKKFFVNEKTENQLVHEALELGPYVRDGYLLRLTGEEKALASRRREEWLQSESPRAEVLIGFNVGCSNVIAYKKLSVRAQRELILEIKKLYGAQAAVVLLGGKEDVSLATEIARGLPVIFSPMDLGLRDGMVSLSACDVIVTGDSLGLHLGVALKKWVVAWFGPTCSHEIDLYDRGTRVMTEAGCAPCWKRQCHRELMCYDQVSTAKLMEGVNKGVEWKFSSYKQRSPETSFSVSPS